MNDGIQREVRVSRRHVDSIGCRRIRHPGSYQFESFFLESKRLFFHAIALPIAM